MRRFVVVFLLALSAVPLPFGDAFGQRAHAQQFAESSHEKGPQFLLASNTDLVPVNVARTPLLGKRISLELDGVTLKEALAEITRQSGLHLVYSDDVLPAESSVQLRAEGITLAAALTDVLFDAGVDVVFSPNGRATLVQRPPRPVAEPEEEMVLVGSIVGRVTEAETGNPLINAQIAVDGRGRTITDADGRYRIETVPAGSHTVSVTLIGYASLTEGVEVAEGATVTLDFALGASALPLDEIVATGTAFETRARTVPNPISVITAREIEQKQATNISDLLRGEIPGVMALSGGQEDYNSRIYVRGNASGTVEDLVKIYIDGVEVAHPRLLSTIDTKSIERIELARGPQSSTIYGSGGASGVLQVFTKKGRPGSGRPRLDMQASAGVIESNFTPSDAGRPFTQDHTLEISGGGESYSYRAGASYATKGEWLRNYGSSTFSLSTGIRAVQGSLTAELSTLWSDRAYTYGWTPVYLRYPRGTCAPCGNPAYVDTRDYGIDQATMGLTLTYRASEKWQHALTLGDDQNHWSYYQPRPSHNMPADTFVNLFTQEYRRRSVRYNTGYVTGLGTLLTARFSGGVDYLKYDVQGSSATDLLNAFGTVRPSTNTSPVFYNDAGWNAGYFGMAELGFQEQVYVTLAMRMEDNSGFGEDYGRAVLPRVGASYVREIGSSTLKLRAQWGKGVRPPPTVARAGRNVSSTTTYIPNPMIAPEEKAGWDAGADLEIGDRVSFSLTRYHERAKNLIYVVPVDLTASPQLHQYQNIGVVAMKGWEAEGSLTAGRFTFDANYAHSQNVVRRVTEATAADPNAPLQVGDRPFDAPKHSGGGRVLTRIGRGSVSLDASLMSGWRQLDVIAYYDHLYGGEAFRGSLRDYYVEYPAVWKWNLRAEQAATDALVILLRIDNLTNNQDGDIWNFNVTPGRTTVVGLRWTH